MGCPLGYIENVQLALHTLNSYMDPQPWVLDQTLNFENDTSGSTLEAMLSLRFFSGDM